MQLSGDHLLCNLVKTTAPFTEVIIVSLDPSYYHYQVLYTQRKNAHLSCPGYLGQGMACPNAVNGAAYMLVGRYADVATSEKHVTQRSCGNPCHSIAVPLRDSIFILGMCRMCSLNQHTKKELMADWSADLSLWYCIVLSLYKMLIVYDESSLKNQQELFKLISA